MSGSRDLSPFQKNSPHPPLHPEQYLVAYAEDPQYLTSVLTPHSAAGRLAAAALVHTVQLINGQGVTDVGAAAAAAPFAVFSRYLFLYIFSIADPDIQTKPILNSRATTAALLIRCSSARASGASARLFQAAARGSPTGSRARSGLRSVRAGSPHT
jgi:hypothetical protein